MNQCDIKLDFKELGWEDLDGTNLAGDRGKLPAVVNTIMKLKVSSDMWNVLTG
jgi:hypothetical protein